MVDFLYVKLCYIDFPAILVPNFRLTSTCEHFNIMYNHP